MLAGFLLKNSPIYGSFDDLVIEGMNGHKKM